MFDSQPFDNGPIACEVLQYRAPKALPIDKQISTPKLQPETTVDTVSAEPIKLSEHAQMFVNRLKKNLKHLGKWARKNKISCYRVYDADLPEYAVAIDIYNDYAHVQEYAPPKTVDSEKSTQRLNDVMQTLPDVLQIPPSHVSLKVRKKQRGVQQYQPHASLKERMQVSENELKFWVNLTDYLDTGLFLDHRSIRQLLLEQAQGKKFLNLFAYTGSATVYAAAGGASSTTTVDMSNTYLNWAKDNMAANGFVGDQHQYIRANCIEWLDKAAEEQQNFDLIFLDPPTFSNSSKMEDTFDIQRDHVPLLKATTALLRKKGTLYFSTNRRDFKFDMSAFENMKIQDISYESIPKDFERNRKIHYCWKIEFA
jgi:23S rRNA (guanine2445-N2)-methyltransferase / 23S rRNA (guanine2069-N7)-methyltransferase